MKFCILLVACTRGGSRILVWGGAGTTGGSREYRDELMTVCNMAPGWQAFLLHQVEIFRSRVFRVELSAKNTNAHGSMVYCIHNLDTRLTKLRTPKVLVQQEGIFL